MAFHAVIPSVTEEAREISKVSFEPLIAPKEPTEAELQAAERFLDLAYQETLRDRVEMYVSEVTKVTGTIPPPRKRTSR